MIATTTQSPPTLPAPHFWGHVGALRSDPLGKFEDAARLGHPVVRMAVGPVSIYLVLTPAAAHEVLVAAPDRFTKHTRGQELLRRTLGDSVLTTEGTDWRWRRRLQQPTFKRTAILGFADRMVERAQAWSDSLQRSSDPVDVAHGANDLTLQIAADALLGVELDAHDKRLVHEALAGILGGFFTLVTFPIPGADRLPLPAAVRHRRAVRTLREVVDRIVAQRRARGVGPDDTDVLGQLLNAEGPEGQRLSDDDLASEVVTLLLAGHETTANALSWTLGLLSRHPAIRRRVVAELNEVLGDRPATAADAHRLPLLDAVLRESMRLFPPVWSVSRSTIGPEVVAGMALPPKSFLFVSTWVLHRMPELWDDPEGFDPDRWLDGRVGRDQKRAWMPFGAGQRRCLGEHFAMLEAHMILATVLRQTQLDLVPGQRLVPDPSVTLRPKDGMWMRPTSLR